MCTSYYSYYPSIKKYLASFMELGLQPKTNGAANEWEFTNVTKLAQLDVEYPGGFSFIPSGSYKGNIFYASWDDEIIKMMEFDASGRPAGNISHPVITNFITGIEGPWGFFFDPQVIANVQFRFRAHCHYHHCYIVRCHIFFLLTNHGLFLSMMLYRRMTFLYQLGVHVLPNILMELVGIIDVLMELFTSEVLCQDWMLKWWLLTSRMK
jgi:hypothetical protein